MFKYFISNEIHYTRDWIINYENVFVLITFEVSIDKPIRTGGKYYLVTVEREKALNH